MAVNFKRKPSGMTQSGKALSALFSGRSLLATWEARSLFPWENLRVLFRTLQGKESRWSRGSKRPVVRFGTSVNDTLKSIKWVENKPVVRPNGLEQC
ncbi:hypothetical protein AVEN_234745-1 [Araneus ventricosus]|uniref:Uncharacterized protein n=1 Tax=Araneus ventricosus TaxID=182803 RepID=A0A4Y1ZKZ6_ARAVE|nr:hypothetical protein AVEN_234745-1 [Araneus ventricosus]